MKLILEVKFHNKWDLLVVFLYIVTCIKQYNTCTNTDCTLYMYQEVWLFYNQGHTIRYQCLHSVCRGRCRWVYILNLRNSNAHFQIIPVKLIPPEQYLPYANKKYYRNLSALPLPSVLQKSASFFIISKCLS